MARKLEFVVLFACILALGGCGGGGDGSDFTTSVQHLVAFQIVDTMNVPVSGVDAILNNGTTASASSGAAGTVSLDLVGIHSVHFKKAGYRLYSYLNRDWTNVNHVQRINMSPVAATYATGTYSGSISGTVSGDPQFRISARRYDGWGTVGGPSPFTDFSTSLSSLSAFLGANDVWAVPYDIGVSAAASYAGYESLSSLASGVAMSLVKSPGTSFSVTAGNGITGGSMYAVLQHLARSGGRAVHGYQQQSARHG